MNINDLSVTVPTMDDMQGQVIPASDFALANGVCFNMYQENGQTVNAAHVCSSTLKRDEEGGNYIQVHIAMTEEQNALAGPLDDKEYLSQAFAGDFNLGFVPKIKNPEAMGMTVETKAGENVGIIKIGDKIPTYPQSFAGADLSAQLEAMWEQNQLAVTGEVTIDNRAKVASNKILFNDEYNEKPSRDSIQEYARYRLGDVEYVRVSNPNPKIKGKFADKAVYSDGTQMQQDVPVWFKCEPYQATKAADGSILCRTALLPGQFEANESFQDKVNEKLNGNPKTKAMIESGADFSKLNIQLNTDDFNAGKFLNKPFLREMLQSVGLDLEQMRAQQQDAERVM